jgi:hypothetical protein
MSYPRLQKRVEYVNQVLEVGPQSFYVGLPLVMASVICFLVAAFTKIKSKASKKEKKKLQQKQIVLYVLGSVFALLGLFLWTPFFQYVSIRYF